MNKSNSLIYADVQAIQAFNNRSRTYTFMPARQTPHINLGLNIYTVLLRVPNLQILFRLVLLPPLVDDIASQNHTLRQEDEQKEESQSRTCIS